MNATNPAGAPVAAPEIDRAAALASAVQELEIDHAALTAVMLDQAIADGNLKVRSPRVAGKPDLQNLTDLMRRACKARAAYRAARARWNAAKGPAEVEDAWREMEAVDIDYLVGRLSIQTILPPKPEERPLVYIGAADALLELVGVAP